MSILKLNLEELLEKYKLQQDEGDYDSILDSELSGGKGKKRPKKPKKKKPKKKKPKKDDGDDYDEDGEDEESEEKGFFAKMFGSKDKSEDISDDVSEDISDETDFGRGMGRGRGRGIRLQREVDQLKDTIANLEEKILMLSNQLDNLSRKYN